MENLSSGEQKRPEPTDFDKVPRNELRGIAQDLIQAHDIEGLRRLKAHADYEINRVPHNSMYSSEWDYWNYSYLLNEVNTALQVFDAENSSE